MCLRDGPSKELCWFLLRHVTEHLVLLFCFEGGLALCVDDIVVLLVEGCALDSWPLRGPREHFFACFGAGRLRQEKTHEILSSILHVPTEGVEHGHKQLEHAYDALVGRLLVFDAFEGIVLCREGSHNAGDFSCFVCCPFSVDCVRRLLLPFELKIDRVH